MFGKTLKTILGLLILPVAIGCGKAFYQGVTGISIFSGTLQLMERGVLVYVLFHVMVARPVYVYVLGHEFVHVIATWLCGGKVVSFNVTPAGGNVVTSKTNFFIELSPYFVPIYTIAIGPVFLLMKAMGRTSPFMGEIFVFLVGLTLAFHFVMTSEVLRIEQPDILKSGFIFSLAVIFIANVVIIMAVFGAVFGSISFVGFLKTSLANTRDIYTLIYDKLINMYYAVTA